jgi:hypothetical protein
LPASQYADSIIRVLFPPSRHDPQPKPAVCSGGAAALGGCLWRYPRRGSRQDRPPRHTRTNQQLGTLRLSRHPEVQ